MRIIMLIITLNIFLILPVIADNPNRDKAILYLKNKGVYIPKNKNLDLIDLDGDRSIVDDDLKYIALFPEVDTLRLGKTNISSFGLNYISELTNIRVLSLNDTVSLQANRTKRHAKLSW